MPNAMRCCIVGPTHGSHKCPTPGPAHTHGEPLFQSEFAPSTFAAEGRLVISFSTSTFLCIASSDTASPWTPLPRRVRSKYFSCLNRMILNFLSMSRPCPKSLKQRGCCGRLKSTQSGGYKLSFSIVFSCLQPGHLKSNDLIKVAGMATPERATLWRNLNARRV